MVQIGVVFLFSTAELDLALLLLEENVNLGTVSTLYCHTISLGQPEGTFAVCGGAITPGSD